MDEYYPEYWKDYQYGSFQGRIKLGAYQSPAAGVSAAYEMALTEWSSYRTVKQGDEIQAAAEAETRE